MFILLNIFDIILTLKKVVISPEAPLELIVFHWLFVQKCCESARTSTSLIFVSWIRKMSGLSDLMMSFIASTLFAPPSPLQFQETDFITSWLIEALSRHINLINLITMVVSSFILKLIYMHTLTLNKTNISHHNQVFYLHILT